MRRIGIAGTLALLLAASMSEAAVGGGAVFDLDRRYYAPGDRVSGRVTFGRGSGEAIRPEAGPFTAYIMPSGRWIDAPRIPQSAMPVGPMQLERAATGYWVASVDFTLPEVGPGGYSLGYCNDPCTISSLGELVGGWFQAVPSHELIPLYASADRTEQRIRSLRGAARTADRRADGLADEVRDLREANDALEGRLAALERATRPAPARPPTIPAPLGWVLVALTVLIGLVMFRPRRRPAPALSTPSEPPAVERIDAPDREPALRR